MDVLLAWLRRKCGTEIDRAGERLTVHGIGLILSLTGPFISATSNLDSLSIALGTKIFSSAKMSWNSAVIFAYVADDKKSTSVREYQVAIGVFRSDIS